MRLIELAALFFWVVAVAFHFTVRGTLDRPKKARKRLPAAHVPDYAKIRRLEIELGISPPDPPVPAAPRVGDSLGSGWSVAEVKRLPAPWLDPPPRGARPVHTMNDYIASQMRWCPKCNRRHAWECEPDA